MHLNRKLQLLLNLCCLTLTLTEIIELSSSDLTFAYDLDVVDLGAVYGKDSLNTYAVRNTTDGDRLRKSGSLSSDNISFENLDTLLSTFLDLEVSLYVITDLNIRIVILDILTLDNFY